MIGSLATSPPGVRRSGTAGWRALVLGILTLLMILHVIQWLIMGRTVSPIEPSESMFTLQNGAVNAGFIFFSLAIVATLIFGRFVCGWGCHIVALQDFCAWLLKKIGLKPRPFRSRLLIYVPLIVALYMFVWPTAVRFFAKPPSEPLIPEFTNHLITSEFWATFPPVAVAIPFLFICGFMTVYFLGAKGFCTYACPYGGFFGVADKLAPGRIRVTDACNECGHCTAVCTSNVIVHREVKEFGMVVDPGCMKCMDCVSVCPNDALYFGFGRPSIGISTKKVPKNFSLTWPEELGAAVVFFLSFMAVWDVYQLVPMLMALGIACVTTFLAVRAWQMSRARDLAFYKWALRAGGRIQKAGWAFLTFAFLWVGTNVHSGIVRYHERAGAIAFQNVQVPDELALASSEPGQWLTPADRASIVDGRDHFRKTSRIGLFTNVEALPKAAWLEYLSGDTEAALERLAEAAARQEGQSKGISLYYRGALLNRLGRQDEAIRDLQEAAADAPDLVTVREEKGEALWRSGQREEAVAVWKDALRGQAKLPVAANFLAGATGDETTAAEYQQTADRLTPDEPYFHWMLGQRLLNLGMSEPAERHFRRAIELDPKFRSRRR